jgi:hypothetical protein
MNKKQNNLPKTFRFVTPLCIETPLTALTRSGEQFIGSIDKAPKYNDGYWVEDVINHDKIIDHTINSDLTDIDYNMYLSFLIDFRKIIETDCSADFKIYQIESICKTNKNYIDFLNKLKQYYGKPPYFSLSNLIIEISENFRTPDGKYCDKDFLLKNLI